MKKFKEVESHIHYQAKMLLFNALRLEESKREFAKLEFFEWRSGGALNYSDLDVMRQIPEREHNSRSVFNEIKFYKDECIYFVPDIVIFHKGIVKYIIEISHKNHLTYRKVIKMRNYFNEYYGLSPDIVEFNAFEILDQDRNSEFILPCFKIHHVG